MTAVVGLRTFVDLVGTVYDPRQMSLSARHEAVLEDGRQVLMLNDRGWTESIHRAETEHGTWRNTGEWSDLNVWASTSVEQIERTARWVVGPDEAYGNRTPADMTADHWNYLCDYLRQQGVATDPLELSRLPHEVVLSDRVLELLRVDT